MESVDGRYFYYHKLADNALWKVPADGGAETLVTNERINHLDRWTLGDQGVYFTEPRRKEHKSIPNRFVSKPAKVLRSRSWTSRFPPTNTG